MAFSEFELFKIEKALKGFVQQFGAELPLAGYCYSMSGHSIVLIRFLPHLRDPLQRVEYPIAKLTYVATQKLWKISVQRSSERFVSYQPHPSARDIESALAVISADELGYFLS